MRQTIIKEITMIHLMFNLPVVVLKDGKAEIKYKWANEEAEDLYKKYQSILNNYNNRLHEDWRKRAAFKNRAPGCPASL